MPTILAWRIGYCGIGIGVWACRLQAWRNPPHLFHVTLYTGCSQARTNLRRRGAGCWPPHTSTRTHAQACKPAVADCVDMQLGAGCPSGLPWAIWNERIRSLGAASHDHDFTAVRSAPWRRPAGSFSTASHCRCAGRGSALLATPAPPEVKSTFMGLEEEVRSPRHRYRYPPECWCGTPTLRTVCNARQSDQPGDIDDSCIHIDIDIDI